MTAGGAPAARPGLRVEFEAALRFELDDFQARALDALDAGASVLVAAPTGSGKTLVAEYAVARARAASGKAFYTTPLKALSNQKYHDLVRSYGAEQVGLLTGDNSINGDAPVVVMTTEVLRNMIYARSPALEGLRYVVLDEVHYLQDRFRGAVWEEVIIHLAPSVDLVCLSATVSNAEEVAEWLRTVRGETAAIIEERRPVELTNLYLAAERGSDALHLLPTFVSVDGEERPNPEAARLDSRGHRGNGRGRPRLRLRTPSRVETVERLAADRMLPAIVFVFSRAGCDAAVAQCLAAGLRLTESHERAQIRRIAEERTSSLSDDDLELLGYREWTSALEAGIAAHHAGMVPPMKEAVEAAFAAGLVKVVFATETLSLGINMPARSVVIEKLSKFTGEHHEFLTPGEYTQLTGRAGRRGIDDAGYAIVCWSPFVPFDQVAGLASRRTYALTSSFRPTYNMAANLVNRYPRDVAHHLLNLSFAQYRTDRDTVTLERRLEHDQELLAQRRATAGIEPADVEEYRRRLDELEGSRRENRGNRVAQTMAALRPGDVLMSGRHGGRVVVLRHAHGRGGQQVLALTSRRDLVQLRPRDFREPPAVVGTIELPRPFAPKSIGFRRELADTLRRAKLRERPLHRRDDPDGGRDARASRADRDRPGDRNRLRAVASIERLEKEIERLERRIRARTDTLARQFDRVLRVLEARGYVDDWALTPAGRRLSRLYTESDLLVAEAMEAGLLDDLDAREFAAFVSCFTYERRGPDAGRPAPPPRWPTSRLARRWRELDRLSRELNGDEDDAGLPETRAPDPGFAAGVFAWVSGEDLADVLDDELTGGDFVRQVKQCIDVLRQISEVAPAAPVRHAAAAAADACFRGVVEASSVVT
ncbi:MAG: DEAD/DEAH box helicase [Actinobacteria bacterium]|nr:DEAD/DEAH box helicase [Actinomycetota bacterium]